MTHPETFQGIHYSPPQWEHTSGSRRYALRATKHGFWAVYGEVRIPPDGEWNELRIRIYPHTFSDAVKEVEEIIEQKKAEGQTFKAG
jgi:hypothetical protein